MRDRTTAGLPYPRSAALIAFAAYTAVTDIMLPPVGSPVLRRAELQPGAVRDGRLRRCGQQRSRPVGASASWLYRPAPEARSSPRRPASPAPVPFVTPSGAIGDWASVLHYGTPVAGSRAGGDAIRRGGCRCGVRERGGPHGRRTSRCRTRPCSRSTRSSRSSSRSSTSSTGEASGTRRSPASPTASPGGGLAAASLAGRGVEFDAALARAALASAHALPSGTWLSVNVSPALAEQADKLAECLAEAPCPLVIEIGNTAETESLLDGPLGRLPGIMIAIDDAGAGYESLARIEKLRPSFMKLHRAQRQRHRAGRARAGFRPVAGHVRRGPRLQVIAEGVETEGERDALRDAGVHLGQGYFVGRPVPVDRTHDSANNARSATMLS